MILLLKILVMGTCAVIAYQDYNQRAVYGFLFPLLGICVGCLHYLQMENYAFFLYISFNFLLVSLIILLLFMYTRWFLKKRFLNHSFGLGDLLFFYAFALGFPSYTFTLLFASSIICALLVFFLIKGSLKEKTVPLAGLMSIFLFGVLGYSLFFNNPSLYFI